MKKILQINSVYRTGSTGRITYDISNMLKQNGFESYVAYGYGESYNDINTYRIQNLFQVKVSIAQTRLFGKHGFYNKSATKRLLRWIDKIQPDIIQLHNIHGHYLNVEILFDYLKKINVPVFWTLHDCWPFTGHCAFFDFVGCDKWQTLCHDCPQLRQYPKSLIFDRSKESFKDKKDLFTGLDDLTLITPSRWLANLVRLSFLKEYKTVVINNGIDLSLFKPTNSKFKNKYNIENKKMVLGIANVFDRRKGFEDFIQIAKLLPENFVVVMVGLSEEQIKKLPDNIIGIIRTNSIKELAEIYSAADVFINPTYEDNFPTVNIESIACGTPVICYDTGGCNEVIDDSCGKIVPKGDILYLNKAIMEVTKKGSGFYKDSCLNRATQYNKNNKFKEYFALYKERLQ